MTFNHILILSSGFTTAPIANPNAAIEMDVFLPPPHASPASARVTPSPPSVSPLTERGSAGGEAIQMLLEAAEQVERAQEEATPPPIRQTPEKIGCAKCLSYCAPKCPNYKPRPWERDLEASDEDEDDAVDEQDSQGKGEDGADEDKDDEEDDDEDGDEDPITEPDDTIEYVRIGCARHLSYCDKACPRYWYQFAEKDRPVQFTATIEVTQGHQSTKRKRDDEEETSQPKRSHVEYENIRDTRATTALRRLIKA